MANTAYYSSLKAFHFPDHLQAVGAGEMPPPVHVRIKPTNRCNQNCWFCAYRSDNVKLGEDMDEADQIPERKMFEIVDDLIAMGVRAVTFSGGGEPLLYKPLPKVVQRLGAAGVKIGCLTNGTNLKGGMADALAAFGCWVRVSINGADDEGYARARGVKVGDYSRVLANIHAFAERTSTCTLGASLIIGRDNFDRVFDACADLKRAGVRHVKLSAAVVGNDISENNAYHVGILDTVRAEAVRAQGLNDDTFQVVDHYHLLGDRFEKPYTRCPSLGLLTVIGADQAIYACQDKAYTEGGRLGSIKDMSFRDFWFSAQNSEAQCAIDPSRHCRHHCAGHAKNDLLNAYLDIDPDHAAFV